MERLIKLVIFMGSLLLIPMLTTMLITGQADHSQRKMGVSVELNDGSIIDGEEFVIGMTASQLSYIKETEALKAWMIVCRTNFKKAVKDQTQVRQKDLSLNYISYDQLEANNGRKTYLAMKKALTLASDETFSQLLSYDNEIIEALYHEVSIGKTVNSSELYDISLPYLIEVDSSYDVESPEYIQIFSDSYENIAKRLKQVGYDCLAGTLKQELAIQKKTENGFVKTIATKNQEWTGEKWKEIFHLGSTNFYLEVDGDDSLRIIALGKGHSMGMSLYGANAMAEQGRSAEEILSHYYPKTYISSQSGYDTSRGDENETTKTSGKTQAHD